MRIDKIKVIFTVWLRGAHAPEAAILANSRKTSKAGTARRYPWPRKYNGNPSLCSSQMSDTSFMIKNITGRGLKGIAEEWTLAWPRAINNRPQATIILGDNGSGKSSIVALIEFCLQGRNGSWLNKSATGTNALINVTSSQECYAQVTAGNGRVFKRTVDGDDLKTPKPFLPFEGFEVSPFVLRRYDIVRFIEQSPDSRQVVLWEYLSKGKVTNSEKDREIQLKEIESRLSELDSEMTDIYSKMSRRCGIDIREIPENPNYLREFLKDYTGFPGGTTQKKIDWNLVNLYKKAISHRRALKDLRRRQTALLSKASLLTSLNPDVEQTLVHASKWITEAFIANATIEIVESVKIALADMKSLEISLLLKGEHGIAVDPYLILSEANINLLALLFYLALIRESGNRGQQKVICFDDIFQSVDKVVRLRVLELIASEFGDWEVIFTTHDRSWAEAIRASFASHRVPTCQIELNRFNPLKGPMVSGYQGSRVEQLALAVSRSDALSIRGLAGVVLEECCNKLSMSISSSVKRRQNDKYTLGDLWPSILKLLGKTQLSPVCRKLDASLFLRNYAVAHYNESSLDISDAELRDFGQDVINFVESVTCRECGTLFMAKQGIYACKCGDLVVRPHSPRQDCK